MTMSSTEKTTSRAMLTAPRRGRHRRPCRPGRAQEWEAITMLGHSGANSSQETLARNTKGIGESVRAPPSPVPPLIVGGEPPPSLLLASGGTTDGRVSPGAEAKVAGRGRDRAGGGQRWPLRDRG